MAEASLAMMVFGGISSFSQSRQQAKAQKQQAAFDSRVAENNATNAENEALQVEQTALADGKIRTTKGELSKGQLRAQLAANGVVVDEDNALGSLLDEEASTALDVLTIKYNADNQAGGLRAEANNYRIGAANTRSKGEFDASQTKSAGWGTLLGNAGKTAGQYATFKKLGAI